MWWVRRPALKIYVGDGVLDVPEGPGNEILLRGIWQGVRNGQDRSLRMRGRFAAYGKVSLKIIIKNAAARWGGGK